jgi:hypothetical protein
VDEQWSTAIRELDLVESINGFGRLGAVDQCVLHIGAGFVAALCEVDERAAAVLREQVLILGAERVRARDEYESLMRRT